MATAIAVGTMTVAQVSKPGADFQIVEREIPSRLQERCGSRCKPVASATVTCSRKRVYGREFNIPSSRT